MSWSNTHSRNGQSYSKLPTDDDIDDHHGLQLTQKVC
jgi:hypothetical protein